MKKIIFGALFLVACTTQAATDKNSTRLQEIDKKLSELHQQLHESRKKEYNAEMEGQPGMLGEYREFTDKISEAQKDDENEQKILKQIQELEKEKQELLKQK